MTNPMKAILAQAMVGIMQNQQKPINQAKIENWESYKRRKSKTKKHKNKVKARKRSQQINRMRSKR